MLATRQWLERAVIGLNLCPFAKAVQARGQIRWVESRARQPLPLLHDLVRELRHLQDTPADETDTTLIVHPQVLRRFADFNDFLGVADEALAELGLRGELQIAAFHPRWVFGDAPAGDMGHHSNRSPHPTLHLLRESSLARAVAAFPDPEAIYGRNIRVLRRLGLAGWQAVLDGQPPPALEETPS